MNCDSVNNLFGDDSFIVASSMGGKIFDEAVLQVNLNLNHQNAEGTSALHAASRALHLDAVQKLLARGANPNLVDNKGDSILHIAAEQDDPRLIKIFSHKDDSFEPNSSEALSSLDIDYNQLNKRGFSALHIAADKGHTLAVELLLQGGAEVNLRSSNSRASALHFAARKGHLAATDLLVKAGADLFQVDKEGMCASNQAAFQGHNEVALKLLRLESEQKALSAKSRDKSRKRRRSEESLSFGKDSIHEIPQEGKSQKLPSKDQMLKPLYSKK